MFIDLLLKTHYREFLIIIYNCIFFGENYFALGLTIKLERFINPRDLSPIDVAKIVIDIKTIVPAGVI
ncbi:MAG: hypothetical protein V3T88_03640, partial [Nitrosomonadaceae bacterium]